MPCSKSVQRPPDELLVQIASYTTCRKTLAALSLCCQQLHTIVEPLLYSKFVQTGEGATALPMLLRTISQKPHLGRYVKAVVARSENEILILDMDFLESLRSKTWIHRVPRALITAISCLATSVCKHLPRAFFVPSNLRGKPLVVQSGIFISSVHQLFELILATSVLFASLLSMVLRYMGKFQNWSCT
jgi:hypothetical protein